MIRSEPFTLVESVEAVFDAAGGIPAVRDLTGAGNSALSNWKKRGRIAASTYLIFRDALAQRGFAAPASLWGITDPAVASPESGSVSS